MTDRKPVFNESSLKAHFRDAHERRAYLRSVEIARRIVEDRDLLDRGRRFTDRHMRDDPHQKVAYRLWCDLLRFPAEEIARRLIADDDAGRYLRETAPVFTVIERPSVEPTA